MHGNNYVCNLNLIKDSSKVREVSQSANEVNIRCKKVEYFYFSLDI